MRDSSDKVSLRNLKAPAIFFGLYPGCKLALKFERSVIRKETQNSRCGPGATDPAAEASGAKPNTDCKI